jgi:septal ring factor EnvC (AmiA/AmiB activator)
MLTGAWKQAITVFLLIIFINSCVQIEIRDREPPVYRKQETPPKPPKEVPKPKEPTREPKETTREPKETSKPKEPTREPEVKPPTVGREQEVKPPTAGVPRVPMPVKGIPIRTHRGYFIKSACDEFFRAVERGKVIYAGDDLKNYGWVVMVEQEDGYISVYTRAERVFVKKGENVKKGQVLGKVGKQGKDCGIGFELRLKNGSPINFVLVKE